MNIGRRIFFLLIFLLLHSGVPDGVCADGHLRPLPFIAHAGGAVWGLTYTNSLEALNSNYEKGHRFFEVDFSWTSDGEIVATHDWGKTFSSMFHVEDNTRIPTRKQFLELETRTGMTQLSLEEVLRWAKEKQDVFVVTDVKDQNLKALARIPQEARDCIIPQVYSYREYREVSRMGYGDVILTLYRMKVDEDELLDFARQNSPFAITMPWRVAQSGLAERLNRAGITVYAHTVNAMDSFFELRGKGVFGVYTDTIAPP